MSNQKTNSILEEVLGERLRQQEIEGTRSELEKTLEEKQQGIEGTKTELEAALAVKQQEIERTKAELEKTKCELESTRTAKQEEAGKTSNSKKIAVKANLTALFKSLPPISPSRIWN